MKSQRVAELIGALESASRKLHHARDFIDKNPLNDEEADALAAALDKVFDHAEAADDALFESKDG